MSDERKTILTMLEQGKITVDEAERLLAALGQRSGGAATPGSFASASASPEAEADGTVRRLPRFLRVSVDATQKENGAQVDVRVPLKLLRSGMRLAAILPKEAQQHVRTSLGEKGIDFDLEKLAPEHVDEVIEALADLQVNVDGDDAKVRIYCE